MTAPQTPLAAAGGTRSTAMWLMPLAAAIEASVLVGVLRSIGIMPPLVVFGVALVAIAALGFTRPGPRVFLIGGIMLIAFVVMNLPFIADALVNPVSTSHAWTDIVATVVGVAGGIAGFAAFREMRRGEPVVRALRAPVGEALAILAAGILIGTTYVSVRGFGAMQGSAGLGVVNGVVKAPGQLPVVLDANASTFTQTTLRLETGPGTIYVVNPGTSAHTFDIELDGRQLSWPVPGSSTVAVVLNLTTSGTYSYWCAIPGHRPGMEGTLDVTIQ